MISKKKRVGTQAIGNRLRYIFDEIHTPITLCESDSNIRLLLKKVLFRQSNSHVNLLGMCWNGPGHQ